VCGVASPSTSERRWSRHTPWRKKLKKAICRILTRHKGKKAAVSIRNVAKELNYKNYAVLKAALEILLAPHAEGIYQTTHTTKYIINTTT
jgi:hypothetical protein